ncbi:AAA family ATPase [Providencia rettgeri]|uniref:AAA family ATPase n=2 Tax=Providencia rettgeri TaxID=587 RepID=UPI0032DA9AC2
MNFKIPLIDSNELNINMQEGIPTFILGANGVGKSSLIYYLANRIDDIKIISAHRTNWLSEESFSLGGNTKEQYELWIKNSQQTSSARWKDEYHTDKPRITLINLVNAENERSRNITRLVDNDQYEELEIFKAELSVINKINELFRTCNLSIELEIVSDSLINARKNNCTYSISKMSDGEKNALLIAANILTIKKNSVVVIDEPERHLHRSIVIPFISNLMKLRGDIKFLISTHDIELSKSFTKSQYILLNGVNYIDEYNLKWDAKLISSDSLLEIESISENILGARKVVVFVEGINSSLDLPLYSLVFPNASIISKSTCKDIMQNVRGIKSSSQLHWMNVFGIIDKDGRENNECEKLEDEGIFCLEQYSVESIYYHPFIQNKMYLKKIELEGEDGIYAPDSYIDELLDIFCEHKERLCNRVIEKKVRNSLESKMPTQREISTLNKVDISIDLIKIRSDEIVFFENCVNGKNINSLISRYPIRETQILDRIRLKLGFQTMDKYENSVIQLLKKDSESLNFVRLFFKSLIEKINTL